MLTPGHYDEGWPSWSPDGKQIAFFSKRGDDPDRSRRVRPLRHRAAARRDAAAGHEVPGRERRRVRDGAAELAARRARARVRRRRRSQAHLLRDHHLAVVSADGGTPRILTRSLDRNVLAPRVGAQRPRDLLPARRRSQSAPRAHRDSRQQQHRAPGRRAARDPAHSTSAARNASPCSTASSKRRTPCTRWTSTATGG